MVIFVTIIVITILIIIELTNDKETNVLPHSRPLSYIFVLTRLGRVTVVCVLANTGSRYSDVIMSTMASQITGVSYVCSSVCSGTYQRKDQGSASLAFVKVDR